MSWRYIATRLNGNGTEEVLDWELPLDPGSVKIIDDLSGPGRLTASIPFEKATLKVDGEPVLVPWSTAIYAEENGHIRFGAILADVTGRSGELALDGVGFSGYADGQPYTATYSKIDVDPMSIGRHIFNHLQGHRDGDIGLTMDHVDSPIRVGTRKVEKGKKGQEDRVTEQPYTLHWFQTSNLGYEFDALARDTPFDYHVRHWWSGETIRHHMDIGYPTLGRRLHDLRFVVGENIMEIPDVEYDGDEYASEVLFLGAGEGRKRVHATSNRSTGRLRRATVVTDRNVRDKRRAQTFADSEVRSRLGEAEVKEFFVLNHPHALFGTFGPGDEILVETTDGWTDELALWSRIVSMTTEPGSNTSRVVTKRVDKVNL